MYLSTDVAIIQLWSLRELSTIGNLQIRQLFLDIRLLLKEIGAVIFLDSILDGHLQDNSQKAKLISQ